MRIKAHPILEFKRGDKITFYYNDREVTAYANETIASALHASGVRKLGISPQLHRPRGLFCAIGNCSSCFMTVNGRENTRICVMKVQSGIEVHEQ